VNNIVLIHTWEMLKSYIPKKEQSQAAEQLVNYLNEDGISDALDELADNCPIIAQVLSEIDGEDYDDEEDEEDQEW